MTTPMGRGPAPSGFRRMLPESVAHIVLRNEPEGSLTALSERHLKAGFHVVGYHFAIDSQGTTLCGRSEHRPAALEGDLNEVTIAVALLGPGSERQTQAAIVFLHSLKDKYPNATIRLPHTP